jgi:hypothetical protein
MMHVPTGNTQQHTVSLHSVDGPSPSGKAVGFDPTIRRFESCRSSHSYLREILCLMIV